MKKILVLCVLAMLTACDKMTSDANLDCAMLDGWMQPRSSDISHMDLNDDTTLVHVNINIKTFRDFARVTYDGKSAKFEKVSESVSGPEQHSMFTEYRGRFPGTERDAILEIMANTADDVITSYYISFDGEQYRDAGGDINVIGYGCDAVDDEFKDTGDKSAVGITVRVPFDSGYVKK